MSNFVKVSQEASVDVTEIPTENDNTILLSTLQAKYPTSTGLQYKSPSGSAWRTVRLVNGKLHAPTDDGWGEAVYTAIGTGISCFVFGIIVIGVTCFDK